MEDARTQTEFSVSGRMARSQCVRDDGIPSQAQMPKLKGFDVDEITIAGLHHHYLSGHFTVEDYIAYCLERIRCLNPYIEAVIETNSDALTIARVLDQQSACGSTLHRLHGIPVLVKDNIATRDSMQTTAGSWALSSGLVPRDAFVVRRLREEGAVILGHANMSEWASVRSKVYSTGYSPRGGQVRNPFDLRKTAFGSSSGSAVAVSTNLVPMSLGTETDTSIIGPASIASIVGFKPTVGLTSRSGVIPISENLDSVGTFGRTVRDAVVSLDAIVGKENEDPFTLSHNMRPSVPYAECLAKQDALKGARFGLPVKRCWESCPPDCKAVASGMLQAVRHAGATIVEVDLPSIEERTDADAVWNWEHGNADKSEWTVVKVDAYNGINTYLSSLHRTPVRTIEDIIEYNEKNAGTEGPHPGEVPAFPTGQDNFHEIVKIKGIKDATYRSALEHIQKQTRENGIDAALAYTDPTTGSRSQLDALIFCDRRGIGQQYAAQAGYPVICIPIGLDANGMPVSLSLQHFAWHEAELVKWASAIEDLRNATLGQRATPKYRNLLAKNIPIDRIT